MAYLLDTNIFIQAKNLHYGFDFCPAFWEWLVAANAEGRVFSIDKVGDELNAGDDELAEWTAVLDHEFFLRTRPDIVSSLGTVGDWIVGRDYEPTAVNTFLQIADFYLVAHALAGRHEIVTHEIPSDSKKRIKIPSVCIGLGIRCLTPFEMLRNERARFVLGPSP